MKRIALTTTYLTVISTRFSNKSLTGRSLRTTARKIAKTLLMSLILAAMSVKTHAADDLVTKENTFDVSMYLDASKKVNLQLAIIRRSNVRITLKDAKNDIIYQEFLGHSTSRYRRKFNFEESKSGVYQFEISDGKQTIVRQIEIVDLPPFESQRYIVYGSANR